MGMYSIMTARQAGPGQIFRGVEPEKQPELPSIEATGGRVIKLLKIRGKLSQSAILKNPRRLSASDCRTPRFP